MLTTNVSYCQTNRRIPVLRFSTAMTSLWFSTYEV